MFWFMIDVFVVVENAWKRRLWRTEGEMMLQTARQPTMRCAVQPHQGR